MNATFLKIVNFLYRIVRVCFHYICAVLNGFRGKKVPPVKNPILLLSATELAKRIRERTLTSVSVVQAYIDRINEVEPYINATVDRCFTEALKEAEEADALVFSGKVSREQLKKDKPLLGVPFTVKILIKVKGLQCTAGSVLLKDHRGEEDGASVTLMKKAGAIVLATTNSPECGLHIQTSNNLYGTTLNPYDTSRTSGGSSGGESALIGAAGSVIGLGNDLLGSLRIPNAFTGIYGHKATRGLISNEGTFPVPNRDLERMLTTGPLCRYAEDLVTTMRILSIPDEIRNKFGNQVHFQQLKVYYLLSFGENLSLVENVDPEIKDAVKRVVSHFHKRGAEVEEVSIPLFKYSSAITFSSLLSSLSDPVKTLTNGVADLDPVQEFIKFISFRSMFTMGYVLALNVKKTLLYNPEKFEFYAKLANKLEDQLNTLLDENSVLVMPTFPFTAPFHNEMTVLVGSCGYTGIFNVLGLPSTQCPVGLNKQGLPIGVQIVSRKANDPLTISCAVELERGLGGWKAP